MTMCVWLPNWPCQRVVVEKLRDNPQAREQPIGPMILYARDARKGYVVSTLNAAARTAGVFPLMSVSQASMLCPNAQFVEHDMQRDMDDLLCLAERAQRFSPITGIESIDSGVYLGRSVLQPQGILLDMRGSKHLFGSEQQLVEATERWFAQQGYVASVAIAHSIGAAWALANYHHRTRLAEQLQAFEMNPNNPLGATCCFEEDAGACSEALNRLPVEALRLEKSVLDKLSRLGVKTIGQVNELPRSGLASRFGQTLLMRIDQVLRDKAEAFQSVQAAPELSSKIALEYPTSCQETIERILRVLIDRLVAALKFKGHGALQVVCRIEMERFALSVDGQPQEVPAARVIQLGLFQPSCDADHLAWLLLGQLDAQPLKSRGELLVQSIQLQATATEPTTWKQGSLFERDTSYHGDEIARLVDSLSARLGKDAVVKPSTTRHPQPELAISWKPLTGRRDFQGVAKPWRPPRRDHSKERAVVATIHELHGRPVQLLSTPVHLAIHESVSSEQELGSASIDAIGYRGRHHRVRSMAGPERIEVGWWQDYSIRRDYFHVELESGEKWWIFCDLKNQNWYLHGIFD